ncbi:T-cell surface protein tactile-like isoform X2 [Mustelus asterias]
MATQAKHGHLPLLLLLINLVRALQGLHIENDRTVTTSPGENITLKCILHGTQNTSIVQIQWSKETNNNSHTILVCNHRFGTYSYMESVEFESKIPTNGTGNINFTNVQVSASGTYTCSFVTFPTGSLKVSIVLTVVEEVISQEDVVESPIVIEGMLNSKIQLPCGFKIPAKHNIRLTWFRKNNGTLEKLIHSNSLGSEINNSSQYRDRIQLGANYSLEINSALAVDDGDYICQVVTLHGREINITIRVNVFAEPMTPQIHEDEELEYFPLNNLRLNVTCTSQKAYPEPNIIFYMDGFPQDGDNDSVTVSEVFLDSSGLYEVKKRLSLEIKADQWRFVWCKAEFSLPGNKSTIIQSRKIPLNNRIESYTSTDLTTRIQLSVATGSSTMSGDTISTELFTRAGLSTTIQSSETSSAFGPSTSIGSSSNPAPLVTSERQYTTIRSSISFGLTNGTESSIELTKNPLNDTKSYTTMNYFNQTSAIGNNVTEKDPEDTVPVAVVVTVILILVICTIILSYFIRFWQIRKKLNGPPPFKPPPPPIKYTAIQLSPQTEVN